VFIIAAMNPSTQTSMYATNEMDPAQLDRFIKIKVHEDANEWAAFAVENRFERSIVEFIASTPGALSPKDKLLEDDEKPMPSPRGWHMVDLILKGKDKLDIFFSAEDRKQKVQDIRSIISAKIGADAGAMYYSSLNDPTKLVLADEIFGDVVSKSGHDDYRSVLIVLLVMYRHAVEKTDGILVVFHLYDDGGGYHIFEVAYPRIVAVELALCGAILLVFAQIADLARLHHRLDKAGREILHSVIDLILHLFYINFGKLVVHFSSAFLFDSYDYTTLFPLWQAI
jgi:hypothetical protein